VGVKVFDQPRKLGVFLGMFSKDGVLVGQHEITEGFAFVGPFCNDAQMAWVIAEFPGFTMWPIVV
jgi:hypothetical protein